MNNYTLRELKLSSLPRAMKIDSTKGNLENFIDVRWQIKNCNIETVEKSKNNLIDKNFIEKIVVCLALVCHSPCRGIKEFLEIAFNYKISLGRISNIINHASEKAKIFNNSQDLSNIKEGALDEIFSNNTPALVGVDLRSSCIFLLEEGVGRSCDDWGLALLEKQEKQGLNLELAVMDQALGMEKGVKEIYGKAKIQSDLFHTIREILKVLKYLERRAYVKIKQLYELEDKYIKSLLKNQGRTYGKKYKAALCEVKEAIDGYDNLWILTQWFYESIDIYSKSYEERVWIYDYVVESIKEGFEKKDKITSLIKYLRNNKEKLLCFARILEDNLMKFKEENNYDLSVEDLKALYRQLTLGKENCKYWVLEGKLLSKYGRDLKTIQAKIKEIINNTFRASSIVENVNSLIRPYFFLRKSIGRSNFLNLLQFYFNTKVIRRCDKFLERIGKTRLELLTGKKHPDWLQILGY